MSRLILNSAKGAVVALLIGGCGLGVWVVPPAKKPLWSRHGESPAT